METSEVTRAIAAATSVAASLGLPAEDAVVIQNSNKLALRLTPCDVLARVTHVGQDVAQLELERAQELAEAGCPVGALAPDVDSVVYTRDSFDVTLWVYYEPATPHVPPVDYARALQRLHVGMRQVKMASPQFRDRIAEAEQVAADPDLSPELAATDRLFLGSRLRSLRQAIDDHGAVEQLLHGEPHPGNVLSTNNGPLFIDFETTCIGPVEFDLAHVPEEVCRQYSNINQDLLVDCRQLVLAMVAAWRWRLGDEFPESRRWGREFLQALHAGPPWPTLDTMTRRFETSPDLARGRAGTL
jgi:aminoglycoside phosphotransferase (APT) family kinase protein